MKSNIPLLGTFFTNEDVIELTKHGVDCEKDVRKFLEELKDYFLKTWRPEYHNVIYTIKTLDDLNKNLLNYPSQGGHEILSNSFTGPCEHLDILSEKSRSLLGYFYGIHL